MPKYNKVLVVSSVCFVATVIFGFLGFGTILKFVVNDQTALRKRNIIKKFYLKLPIPMEFRVYFFNVSNPSEVQSGQTPIVQEIGPYIYDTFKEKIEVSESTGEDSLTYTPYETYFYNQEKSGNLKPDDYVTILHPLIVGIVNTVARDSPPLLTIVNKAIASIFRNPKNIYLTTKVKDILFDGVVVNCSVQDFASKAVCTQLKSQTGDLLKEVQRKIYKFSILGPRNGTLPNRFKVLRGIKQPSELGRLVELNNEKELQMWPTNICKRFKGTDGWIFPPFVNKNEGIWAFSADLCRSVHATYVGDAKLHGVTVQKFYADLGDVTQNPEEKCYCPRACLPRGVMDLSKCMGVPIYATLPHFLKADESLLKKVKGLNPITEEHIVRIILEPMLSVPLEAQKRMQFNLAIQSNSKVDLMNKLPEALHPILWVEEGIVLEGTLLKLITSIFIGLRIFDVIKYCLLAVSVGGMSFGGYLHYKTKRSTTKVTPKNVQPEPVEESVDEKQSDTPQEIQTRF